MVARRAHNPKAVGSSPAPATKKQSECESESAALTLLFIHTSWTESLTILRSHSAIGSLVQWIEWKFPEL